MCLFVGVAVHVRLDLQLASNEQLLVEVGELSNDLQTKMDEIVRLEKVTTVSSPSDALLHELASKNTIVSQLQRDLEAAAAVGRTGEANAIQVRSCYVSLECWSPSLFIICVPLSIVVQLNCKCVAAARETSE